MPDINKILALPRQNTAMNVTSEKDKIRISILWCRLPHNQKLKPTY